MDTLISYALSTRDTTTFPRSSIEDVLTFHVGDDNFMPLNDRSALGNDDQTYWALAAMSGVENELFEDSAKWEQVLANVWNSQARRWDDQVCGGGLRWQIFSFNKGYDYKNSGTNMNFFLLSARLAAYTDNSTYSDWATKVYDWSEEIGLIGPNAQVYDGVLAENKCEKIDKRQWSSNSATAAYGAAIMETLNTSDNITKWGERKTGLLTQFKKAFTNDSILVESACEDVETCNPDSKSFKGIAARYLGKISQLDESAAKSISPVMEASAKAAAASCQDDGSCGFIWTDSKFDEDTDAAQQMNALSVITGLLASNATGSGKDVKSATDASGTATDTTPSATGTDAASGTATGAATVSQTGAASSLGAASAAWGIGALALGFAALL